MKKFEKIFTQHNPLSAEEIEKYLSGKLSAGEKHLIEQKLNADEFAAEAMEGFEQNPALIQIDFKTEATKFNIYKIMFFATTAIALVSIVYWFTQNKNTPNSIIENKITKPEREVKLPVIIVSDSIIDNTKELESKEQINYKQTVSNRPKTIAAKTAPEATIISSETEIKNTDVVTVSKKEAEINVETNSVISKSNVKFIYLHDLKVVDYSNIYTGNIPVNKFALLTGTPANLSNKNESLSNEHNVTTVYIPYEEFLSEALLDFKNGNFKAFLKNTNIILKHYPDDLNAYFYGGLALYNLNRCENAIVYFDKCIFSAYNTFYQEALWYKALSLLRCKKQSEAENMMKEIVAHKGFYAEQAQKKLSELKK